MSNRMNETIGALALKNTVSPVIYIENEEDSRRTNNEQAPAAYTVTTEKGGEALSTDSMSLTQEVETSTIAMNAEQEIQFCSAIKTGIYKSLHQKGLLTDAQLFQLLSRCQ